MNSEVPRAMEGVFANQAHKCLIRRERSQAWPGFATSESRRDGVIQTFSNIR